MPSPAPTTPAPGLEALLRDACHRALSLGLSFTNQIRLYRSVLALAREVRLRCGGAMPYASAQNLATLLAAVCEHASAVGLDPELPLPDAILMQRFAVQLSRAARRAGAREPIERAYLAQHPLHREEPAQAEPAGAAEPPEPAMHREEPAQHEAAGVAEPPKHRNRAQNPLHREKRPKQGVSDDRLTAWRNDHTTERDKRAHELLRTVIDERLIAKVKAMNERDRQAREAVAS